MLDIKLFRENPNIVKQSQKKKKKDVILTDLFKKEEVKLGKLERKLAPAVKD